MLEKWLWRKKANKHEITMRQRATVRRFRGRKNKRRRREKRGKNRRKRKRVKPD